VDALLHDVRYALRALGRARGFTVATVLALTLGVGATTALFAVLWAVLLRPLPYRSPDRLVTILHGDSVSAPVSPADYFDFRQQSHSFAGMAAAQAWGANLAANGRAERIPALQVTGTLFDILGVGAELGRAIQPGDDQAGQDHVAVLSHGLWTRRFGADPAIVGRQVQLNGEAFTVVGVMPPAFWFAPFWQTQAELWVPLALDQRKADRNGRSLRVFARLADGVSVAQARSEMAVITARLAHTYPASNEGLTTGVVTVGEKAAGNARAVVLVLFGLACAVLLIACANVSTLTLARATSRGRELALRAALGAGRGRLIRLLVVEGFALGLIGSLGGAALAWAGLTLLARVLPPDALPPHAVLDVSSPMLAFALGASLVSGLAASLVPALQMDEGALINAVRDGRAVAGSPAGRHARHALVSIEVALALLLLVAAGLLGRTLLSLRQVRLGFEPMGVVALSVSLQGSGSADPAAHSRFFDAAIQRVAGLPGVTAAGAINHLPLAGDLWTFRYLVDGQPPPRPGQEPGAAYRVITPGYFQSMSQRLVEGRAFESSDREDTVPVVIVNQALARRWWPRGGAIGQRIRFAPQNDADSPRTIVGVVMDAQQRDLVNAPTDEAYIPLAQRPRTDPGRAAMTVVARGHGTPAVLLESIKEAVWQGDPQAAVFEAATLDEVLDRQVWREQVASNLVSGFALVALVLSALGINGIVSHGVSTRVREFGVRVALGATPSSLPRLAMREALLPVTVGLAAGIVLALAAGRMMRAVLVGVDPADPWVLSGTLAALATAAAVAAWRPAARTSKLDPAVALRRE
jgi:putative ABC transport system permease protein